MRYVKTFESFTEDEGAQLISDIRNFLDKYAAKNPNRVDDDDDKFTGPDPYQLLSFVDLLEKGQVSTRCWSEWGSGCYKPYSSREGREEHDNIIKRINDLIKHTTNSKKLIE